MSALLAFDLAWLLDNPLQVWDLTVEHLWLTGISMAAAGVIALPLGVAVARRPWLDLPVLGTLGIVYTIPSLALLVLLVPWLGLGRDTAIVALAAYAQVVLVRQVVSGLRGVDPAVVEAARAMGMGRTRRLLEVELRLAAPVILAGVRVATVSVIGIGTVGALVKAGGLGELLFVGVRTNHHGKILAGAIAVSLLALGLNLLLRAAEERTSV